MRNLLLLVLFILITVSPWKARSQKNSLFDDTRVSSIYVDLPPDTLAWIYNNVLSEYYFHARFIFDDGTDRDTLEDIGFRLRGNTSRYSAKKSFKISFSEYVQGRKYKGVKKINLNGEHNDPTMVREKFFYDMWKKAGLPERRTAFVNVYINGSYYGLYTNLEELEKEWVSRVFPESGGNLYKCVYPADLVYLGSDQQIYKNLENSTVTGGRVYDLQTNKSLDDYTRLVTLITALDQPVNEQFTGNISQILNVDGFLKALAMDVATGNWDDYAFNKNNFFLYDNPATGRFEFITYDPDNTVGVDWFHTDWAKRNCLNWINTTIDLPLASKILAVTAFFSQYRQDLDYIARHIINPDSIFARLDQLHLLITPAAINDTYRTLDYGYDINDFHNGFTASIDSHTPYGIKPFLSTRYQTILEQLYPSGISGSDPAATEIAVFPNPADDVITLMTGKENDHPYDITITDLMGRILKRSSGSGANENKYRIVVSDLPPGMYTLSSTFSGRVCTLKFLKK